MLRRFITDNKCVIGIFSIFIVFVISCSDRQDSAKDNKAEESVETTIIDFGNESYNKHLLKGWSSTERWPDETTLVWSNGKVSKLEIVVSEVADKQALLRCLPFDYPKAPGQTIKVSINDKFLTTIELDKNWKDWREYKFFIPASDLKKGQNILTFDYGYVKSPSEAFQGNTDARPLAVAFDYIKIASLVETTVIDFGNELHREHLLEGWYSDEKVKDGATFVWSNGKLSKLEIVVSEVADKKVILRCLPFDYPEAPGQTIKVSINDKFLTTIELDKNWKNWKDWREYKFPIPASDLRKGKNILTFEYAYAKSPPETIEGSKNARLLAVAFDYIKIAPLVETTVIDFGNELHKEHLVDRISKITKRPTSIVPQFVTVDYKCPDCNLIFIMIDTLRADHLGSYGYERDTSLNIDAFAEKSILFENVRSQAACTFPSVNSILTSKYPSNFLGQSNGRIGIPEHIKSLAELLKDKNYSTIAISASPIVRKTPSNNNKFGGFDRGFDFFNEGCELKDASCINDKVFKLLNSTKSPFFLYLHYMDPHDPYSPPKEFIKKFSKNYNDKEFIKEGNPDPIEKMLYSIGSNVNLTKEDIKHLIDLYDDEIAYFDSQFKILLDKISEKDLMDKTIIIITADHGEEFMEHNSIKHCHTLFNTETKIPLIIRIPSINKKVADKVQALDIIPTILDYLNFSLSDYSFDGKGLRPVIESNLDINKNVFSAQFTLRSINDDRYKLIYDISLKTFLLYDLKEDKDEIKNIMGTKTNVLEELKGKLFEWLYVTEGENMTKSIENAEEIKKQLKALGYIE